MSDSKHTSARPPKKHRDPALVEKSSQARLQSQDEYVKRIVSGAARNVFGRGKTSVRVRIGQAREGRIKDLCAWTGLTRETFLNVSITYAWSHVKAGREEISELRFRARWGTDSAKEITFTPTADTAALLIETGVRDARHVLLNAGVDLLHERLMP